MIPPADDVTKQYFCYLFFYTIQDACVGFVIIALTILILFYAIFQYRKTSRINMLSKSIKLIYVSIFLWGIAYLLKLCFGEVIFFVQKSNQKERSDDDDQMYSVISKYLFALDLIGVFIVQAILALVIYNWMNNIVAIFSQISEMEDAEERSSVANHLKFEINCRRLVKFYLVIRFFFFGLLVAFLALPYPETEGILTQIMLILLLAEAYVVIVILLLGMKSVKGNNKLGDIVNEQEIRQMLLKYGFLLLFATTRAVVDTIFVFKNFSKLANKEHCYIDVPQVIGLNFANVIFEGLFTHCLPILLVVRIYRVQQTTADLTESLLAAEQYTGSNDKIETENK